MRQLITAGLGLLAAASATAQTSLSACGPLPDSSARQSVKVFDGLRVCLVATRVTDPEAALPQDWAAKGATVVIETQRDGDNRRVAIEGNRVSWTINGRSAPLDSLAERWQKAVIELLDAKHEADALREQSTSLRMEIDSLPARRAAAAKRLEDLERLQKRLDQELLAERNRETLARNETDRLQRQINDLQNRISSEERRASSITDPRARASVEANLRGYYDQIRRLQEELRRREGDPHRGSRRLADIEDEMRRLRGDGNVAMLRLQLANYDSTSVRDLEEQLTQLDAQRRLPELDSRVEQARRALIAVLDARGKAPSP
jgi:chromosome segregation ATPase